MKEDDPENRPKLRYFRYAVISFTALIVLSLGFSLVPADPPEPGDPPFSEQARAAALQDALDLRAAAGRLSAAAGASGDANPAAAGETVTLLTLQARAFLSPADSYPPHDASASATPLPSGPPSGPSATPEPTTAGLASALSASGVQRLTDAAEADGGMARLLAGAGTAQLLAAENLAAAAGIAPETLPHAGAAAPPVASPSAPAPDATASACPSPFPAPGTTGPGAATEPGAAAGQGAAGQGAAGQGAAGQGAAGRGPAAADTPAGLGLALSAAVAAEQQSTYAYQAALPRLGPVDSQAAEAFLGQHRELAAGAAAYARAACSTPQSQQPGFVLDPDFLAAPGEGLARLELAALPAYGDVIARADGGLRAWAIAALQSAARRAAHWNGVVGPVPGVLLDQDQLPELPASPAPPPAETRGPARP
ncbi:DUF4439 domain-containing protein [Pseudarthrobacter quantipunctorum]|uniref:DUF4439 domain-containing protein n=1 Tax=Pseudarthrobacter quantipunctorum TaxID=3128980 RepID=A0ABZ2R011_9MICC